MESKEIWVGCQNDYPVAAFSTLRKANSWLNRKKAQECIERDLMDESKLSRRSWIYYHLQGPFVLDVECRKCSKKSKSR